MSAGASAYVRLYKAPAGPGPSLGRMAYRNARTIQAKHGRPSQKGDPEAIGRQALQWYERGEDEPVRGVQPKALEALVGMAATGLPATAYAKRIGKSPETIKSQLKQLRSYYGCEEKNILHLYMCAVQAGDIPVADTFTPAQVSATLTRRQRQTLFLYGVHGSNKRVAEAMGVTIHTVKWHLLHASKALGCHSAVQAYARARELRLF